MPLKSLLIIAFVCLFLTACLPQEVEYNQDVLERGENAKQTLKSLPTQTYDLENAQ